MSKLKLGTDFSDEATPDTKLEEESAEKTTDDESEDEKENSANSDDGKNEDGAGDESTETDEDESDESNDDKSEDDKGKKPQDKKAVLQALLDEESNIDKTIGDVDAAIAAAKQRISQKRADRREKRDLVETVDNKFPEIKEETDDLSDIDAETLKVLERFTKAKGLVPKSELAQMSYKDQHKAAQDAFYEAHPEYLPSNDPDDVLYNALKKELALYAAPTDPKLIPKLFEKAHKGVIDAYPDKFKKPAAKVIVDDKKKDEQQNKTVRLKTAGLGGKSGGSGAGKGGDSAGGAKKSFSDAQIRALQDGGWTDEEIKELTT